MDGCTGSASTWMYWMTPNRAPTSETTRPAYMSVAPMIGLPNTLKTILSSMGGSCRSASLANATGATASAASVAGTMNRVQFWALAIFSSYGCVQGPKGL